METLTMTAAQIERAGEIIVECLGYDGAFEALIRALGYDLQEEYFKYIAREYEIPIYGDEEDEE